MGLGCMGLVFKVKGSGFRESRYALHNKYRIIVWNSGLGIRVHGFRVHGLRVYVSGFRVQG